jgi:predicted phage terminase large subunit-like protein
MTYDCMTIETLDDLRTELISSLMSFTKFFFEIRNSREFHTPLPIARPSHYKIIVKKLEDVFDLKILRLLINVPPGHGKSTHLVYFVAWALAQYPDSHFLYISVSHELAETHVSEIKAVMDLPDYIKLFGVRVDPRHASRGDFKTTAGGRVSAKGATGTIVGLNAGLPYLNRFSGACLIDDAHKPDEVHSDTMRESVIKNYSETIKQRVRGGNVPIISIGQRLHEDDLSQFLIDGKDGDIWETVILKAIDDSGNALCPSIKSLEFLLKEKEVNRYVFWSQYQQTPQPAGGSLFLDKDFIALPDEPNIFATFITGDTAETDKTWNDPTVFSFWGVYEIEINGSKTGQLAVHWLDCWQEWLEPSMLEPTFLDFYARCMRHALKPEFVAIEKKSTGVTLLSALHTIQGIRMMDIERTKASGSKTARFIEMAPFVAQKLITLPLYAKHTSMCIEHMSKITANNTHKHDDIADTAYDAVKAALIDKLFSSGSKLNEASRVLGKASAQRAQLLINRNRHNNW